MSVDETEGDFERDTSSVHDLLSDNVAVPTVSERLTLRVADGLRVLVGGIVGVVVVVTDRDKVWLIVGELVAVADVVPDRESDLEVVSGIVKVAEIVPDREVV